MTSNQNTPSVSYSRNYVFTTFKEPTIDINHKDFRYVVYQKEITPTTNKIHYQGYIEFSKSIYWKTVKTVIGDDSAHIEKRKGTRDQARDYCMKLETRSEGTQPIELGDWKTGGQGSRNDLRKMAELLFTGKLTIQQLEEDYPHYYIQYYKTITRILEQKKQEEDLNKLKTKMKSIKLRKWQQDVLEQLKQQNDREVIWVYDSLGNNGKTHLAKYLMATENTYYCQNGKVSDISYAFNNEEYVVFNYTRHQEEFINYSIIESFKDGILFSPKYESKTKIFEPCKVVVMANFKPDKTKLSLDRWNIIDLEEHLIENLEDHILSDSDFEDED